MQLRVLTDEEAAEHQINWELTAIEEAWRQWELHSCVERHGGHRWILTGEHPDDDSTVGLDCDYCPATSHDLCPDIIELLEADIGEIKIRDGKHDYPRPFAVPVKAWIESQRYSSPWDWDEWDWWMEVEAIGQVRYWDA